MNIKDIFSEKIYHEDEVSNFENHFLGEQKLYRLHYFETHFRKSEGRYSKVDMHYKPFMLPVGMSGEDGFKVLSYLTDYTETKTKINWKSVQMLDKILDLESLGFTKINDVVNSDDVIDLFIVFGEINRFMDTPYYQKYFEWYTPNITKEEVENIYNNLNNKHKIR